MICIKTRIRRDTIVATHVAAVLAASSLAAFCAAAQARATGIDLKQLHQFEIPSEDLNAALTAFSAATRIHVVASSVPAGVVSPGINGDLSNLDALNALLRGTGMSFRQVDAETLVVVPAQMAQLRATEFQLVGEALADQPTAAAAPEASTSLEPVVVTGTRIVRNGFDAPTPVSVLSEVDIDAVAPTNIADYVNTLPELEGSSTPTNQLGSISAGTSGINALNLRDLGTTRTLVLLDGQRVVGSALTGIVDVNEMPQTLISRVDVVTGGASAAWGSDAVSGVVNFVLDKTFTGLKTEVEGGESTYGDDRQYKFSVTAGTGFADGRGHALFSVEDIRDQGIEGAPRPWLNGYEVMNNPAYTATNGQPGLLALTHVGESTGTPGAIIASGPLAGIYFGPGGAPAQLNYGSVVSAPFFSGGDWQYANFDTTGDLDPSSSHQSVFGRVSYDVGADTEVFAQASYGRTNITAVCCIDYELGNVFTIQNNNPYLPASVAAAMAADSLTSVKVGSLSFQLPPLTAFNNRVVDRIVVGANGKFDALGSTWSWDAYAEDGISLVHEATDAPINANYTNAIAAVRNPATGGIVCQSTLTTPNNGCEPYDILGTGVASQAAINYIMGTAMGFIHLTETVEAATLNGEPFHDWAGPVSLATGVENRREAVSGSDDPLSAQNAYFAGNYKVSHGDYNVTEGFIETVVPLASDMFLAKSIEFDGAARATDYSLSGYVTTWKVGANWAPIEDIKFRATRSRDIRAPNLAELFTAGATSFNSVSDPFHNNLTETYYGVTSGNLALAPEKADTTELGVVLQPRFIPGFSASFDYFDINIMGAISTISAQNIVNACYNGISTACGAITRNATTGLITEINVKPINLVSLQGEGFDIETSYRTALRSIVDSWPGDVTLRVLATHYINNYTNNGINPPTNSAGTDGYGGGVPSWVYNAAFTYSYNPFSLSLDGRGLSSGLDYPTYIQCTSSCPASTANNPTINNNHVAGTILFDTTLSYKFGGKDAGFDGEAYLRVENLANRAPVPVAENGIGGALTGTYPTLYDVIGRLYKVGVRWKL